VVQAMGRDQTYRPLALFVAFVSRNPPLDRPFDTPRDSGLPRTASTTQKTARMTQIAGTAIALPG
jgi:hypothetical protein